MACNFNPAASIDDGSCEFYCPGCTDVEGCNFDPGAIQDDGSCTFPEPYYDCEGLCVNDADSDGVCDEFEISGCTDELACNYDAQATEDDGSCAGAIDQCGICGGDGAPVPVAPTPRHATTTHLPFGNRRFQSLPQQPSALEGQISTNTSTGVFGFWMVANLPVKRQWDMAR